LVGLLFGDSTLFHTGKTYEPKYTASYSRRRKFSECILASVNGFVRLWAVKGLLLNTSDIALTTL